MYEDLKEKIMKQYNEISAARGNDTRVAMDCGILTTYSLADCEPAPATTSAQGWSCKSKKDENPMNNAYASATMVAQDTTEKDKIRYLTGELYEAYAKAKKALQHKFGLLDDDAPFTLTDTIKRIQDGLFVIPEKYKDKDTYGSLSYLRWRDPKAVEDKIGYQAAKEVLKAAYADADRTIRILTPVEGLKALKDFETAQTPKAKK